MNIDYNSEESYDVEFFYFNTTFERILSLKTTDFQNKKPGKFTIGCGDWNHATLGAFLDVLYYFKERGIQWQAFSLRFKARDQSFTSVLLQTVNGLNIFKKMELVLIFADDEDEYSADCEYLFPGINQNKQLESLNVRIDGFRRDRFEDDFTAFAAHLREMTTLKELSLRGMVHFNQESFLESLSEKKSLEKLHLHFDHCNDITDEGISNIVTSLSSHPKLEDLSIDTNDDRNDDQFGELSSKSLQNLLSKTQTLSKLSLNNFGDNGSLNAECIIQGLKKNQSLKSLTTINSLYGDLMLSRFFQILPHCPNLEYLGLWEESMTKNDLEQVIHMDRLQKPINLLLLHDDVVSKNASVMTELLRCHPEVRLTFYDFDKVFEGNLELEHISELNWHGRYMIDRPASAPLSLWPLVFEFVNNSGVCDDKPSVIYEFLKGPAFAGRDD